MKHIILLFIASLTIASLTACTSKEKEHKADMEIQGAQNSSEAAQQKAQPGRVVLDGKDITDNKRTCSTCQGTGKQGNSKCSTCQGYGYILVLK